MGTYLNDFIARVRRWVNVNNTSRLTDADITEWVRMAEERFNTELKTSEMFVLSQQVLTINNVSLPADFNQLEYLRNTVSGLPYEYVSSDEYWRRSSSTSSNPVQPFTPTAQVPLAGPIAQLFTILGTQLFLYPAVDGVNGTPVELAYYNNIPPLTNDTDNWLHQTAPRLYMFATLAMSAPFLDEDARASTWETEATGRISQLNSQFKSSKLGGGPLRPRRRSFG